METKTSFDRPSFLLRSDARERQKNGEATAAKSYEISPAYMIATISEHRSWFTILGVLLIILGIIAIAFPFATTIAAKTVLGSLFMIAVGILILAKLPSSAIWAIGLLVGINLISSGWAYIFLAMATPKKA